ncbi:MAG: hypothetical protein LIP06_01655 [Tannerellaceae bacterium]|nr:hypothetical protein [Tannerellaceae bacterium]
MTTLFYLVLIHAGILFVLFLLSICDKNETFFRNRQFLNGTWESIQGTDSALSAKISITFTDAFLIKNNDLSHPIPYRLLSGNKIELDHPDYAVPRICLLSFNEDRTLTIYYTDLPDATDSTNLKQITFRKRMSFSMQKKAS